MKKISGIIIMLMLAAVCTGCTNYAEEYSKNTLVVKSSGKIIEIAVEDFKDTKVKAEDLTTYIKEQIDAYNKENGWHCVKQKTLLNDDLKNVKLVIQYKNIDAYNGFNAYDCVLTDYSEVDKDLLTGTFKGSDGKTVKVAKFKNTDKAKVLIVSEATDIVLNKDVLYYNDQVTIKKGVITTSGKDKAVIIYK